MARIETTTRTLFAFEELSDDAKQKALEALSDINVDYPDWHEFTLEDWKETLHTVGVDDANINYSGFWSQGDGASFTGRVRLADWLKSQHLAGKYRTLYNRARAHDIAAGIRRVSSHYSHEQTCTAWIEIGGYWSTDKAADCERLERQANECEELLEEWRRMQCHAIYKDLENNYEYLTGEDAIRETILANEYEFLEDGTLA